MEVDIREVMEIMMLLVEYSSEQIVVCVWCHVLKQALYCNQVKGLLTVVILWCHVCHIVVDLVFWTSF